MTLRTEKRRERKAAAPSTNGHVRRPRPVHYPESDGKPMAETWIHVQALVRLLTLLRILFRERGDVHIGGNMMMYWVEGDPRHRLSPDAFIKLGTPPEPPRRTWKIWVDGVPTVIVEVTSKKTRKNDTEKKYELYRQLGVQEYYLFDPLGDYLRPRFQGHQLVDGAYQPLTVAEDGSITSAALGARLMPGATFMRVFDLATGEEMLDIWDTPAVAESELKAQTARAAAAERRVAELERLLREREDR